MPFESQAQAKWAFATKQPWARRWGKLTKAQGGIRSLPQYVTRKNRKWGKRRAMAVVEHKEVVSAIPAVGNASGPGGLFSAAGLEKGRSTRRAFGQRRPQAQVAFKEGTGHTSAMVAFYLPSQVAGTVGAAACALFADRAECACDLHITLAYLGKVADIEARIPLLVPVLQRYVQMWCETVGEAIPVVLQGYSSFDTVQEDGSVPVYRVVESPLLEVWVDGLERVLTFGGVPAVRDFGPFTPHVTVAYTYPEIAAMVPKAPFTPVWMLLSTVTIALGDMHINLPLTANNLAMKAAVDDSGARARPAKPAAGGSGSGGTGRTSGGGHEQIAPGVVRIRGNLCQVHGKFGPCDSASSEGFDKKPKKGKGGRGGGKGGKGAGKPKPTDEEKRAKHQADVAQRRADADAQKVQNRTDSLAKLSSRPNDKAMAVLDTLRQGGAPDQAMVESMAATGLVQKHSDGSFTLSSSGHGLLNALDRGDAGAAAEALAGGKDKVSAAADQAKTREERQTAHAQALADRAQAKADREKQRKEREQARAKRKGGSGSGSGSGKAKSDREKRIEAIRKLNEDAIAARTAASAAKPKTSPIASVAAPAPTPVTKPAAALAQGRVSSGARRPVEGAK